MIKISKKRVMEILELNPSFLIGKSLFLSNHDGNDVKIVDVNLKGTHIKVECLNSSIRWIDASSLENEITFDTFTPSNIGVSVKTIMDLATQKEKESNDKNTDDNKILEEEKIEETKDRVVDLLSEVKTPISKDTIYVILHLERDIELNQDLINNMKEGKIEAIYTGKPGKAFDIRNVSFKLRKNTITK